jgi:hypothetical protein
VHTVRKIYWNITEGEAIMSNTNIGGPAFPTARVNINGVDEQDGIQAFGAGMTLRDYFAAKAMQGLIGSPLCEVSFSVNKKAEDAYLIADAMIQARES